MSMESLLHQLKQVYLPTALIIRPHPNMGRAKYDNKIPLLAKINSLFMFIALAPDWQFLDLFLSATFEIFLKIPTRVGGHSDSVKKVCIPVLPANG